jgi:LPS export ABC transporter protein LptC
MLKRTKKATYNISVAAIISIVAAMFFSCKSDIKQINSLADIKNFPNQSAKNIEILYSDSAKVKMKIFAPVLHRFSDEKEPYVEFPDGITVYFYTAQKEVESSLKSNYAIFYEIPDIWEAKEDVVVVNRDGDVINTELLIWERKKELLHSDKFVKITTKDEILYGEGFEADQNFTNYTIHKPTGVINLNED